MARLQDSWHTTTPKPASERDGLRSVASALDLLECFAVDGELGVSDLARRMGIAKSTAHRLLSTLRSRGFVEQSRSTGRYRLGLHLFELGHLAHVRSRLRQVALPICQELVRRTGLTVNLSVADGPDVIFLERLEGADVTSSTLDESGRRLPAHVSSSGKALAAWNTALATARAEAGFPPRARNTVRTAADWDAALAAVRRRGHASSRDEAYDGVSSIAVPVLDRTRQAVAAISFFGPTEQLENESALVRLLHHAANRISTDLAAPRRED